MKRYLSALIIIILLNVVTVVHGDADTEDLNHKDIDIKNKKCETECHTEENVKKAREDREKVDECRDCHVGPDGNLNVRLPGENTTIASKNKTAPGSKSPYENMILIPEGKFIMGTNDRWDDEGPQYTVFLEAFYIDIYEVSNAEYKKFVDAAGHNSPNHWKDQTFLTEKANHPVVYVTWYDADEYCKWAGKRLPTQEEWEKAARGTDGRNYPWGNEFDPARSNNPMKNSTGTEPVNSYENGKSQYGMYNMSGNVWEWTASWYKAYPGSNRPRPNYGETHKVLKGGSWYNCHSYDCGISAPVYNRAAFEPKIKTNSFGFRCAKDP